MTRAIVVNLPPPVALSSSPSRPSNPLKTQANPGKHAGGACRLSRALSTIDHRTMPTHQWRVATKFREGTAPFSVALLCFSWTWNQSANQKPQTLNTNISAILTRERASSISVYFFPWSFHVNKRPVHSSPISRPICLPYGAFLS